jgi:diguanylate cyclase (GGDEF)-like protein
MSRSSKVAPHSRRGNAPVGPATATPPVPTRAFWISLAALCVAGVASLVWPAAIAEYSILVWLLALVPPFLLAYYRGWQGAAAGLLAAMLVLIGLQLLGTLALGHPVDWRIAAGTAGILLFVSFAAGLSAELLHRQAFRAVQVAYADVVTGLGNRRVLEFFLERQVAGARRGGSVAVAMFDIDDFKSYNDRFGHAAGDEALAALGRVLAENTRGADLSARYGGEEFTSVLAGTGVEGALVFAQRVRTAFRALEFPTGARLSLSGGVASSPPLAADGETLIRAADAAMYEAKRRGKDQVLPAGLDTPPPRRLAERKLPG